MNKIKIIAVFIFFCMETAVYAQDTALKKTIDITSTFKPSLRIPYKIGFTANPADNDTVRPILQYKIPVQNPTFNFFPAALKPLAYQDTSKQSEINKAYIKLGFGNFTTPYCKAVAGYGDGDKINGTIEADFISSKGKLDYQKYLQYGIKSSTAFNVNTFGRLRVSAGFEGLNTYKYGYLPDTLKQDKDSLKLQYTGFSAGAAYNNFEEKDAAIWYSPSVSFGFFGDNNSGKEAQFSFAIPLEKRLNDDVAIQVGISGMLDRFNGDTVNFNNTLLQVNAGAKINITENIQLKAGIIPSWNNSKFQLLPDFTVDFVVNNSSLVFQTGFRGHYQENTYRSLVAFNPWIQQPHSLTNTANNEIFASAKAVVDEHFSFRIKAGYVNMRNVYFFLNDFTDGKTFKLLHEEKMNKANLTGELTWKIADKFQWYNSVSFNSFGGIDTAPTPYGLLPFELHSSARVKVINDLYLKADLYSFGGSWFTNSSGTVGKTKKAFDLNIGAEFNLHKNIDLWMQFNNMFNQQYQRWNQYTVLGFQVLGGVIFHL